jgi:hypothetical protein
VLRFLIPLALVVAVLVAVAAAPGRHTARPSACAHSERQLASVACRPLAR